MSGALPLRAAVRARLAADAALAASLGGPRIHDEPPRALAPPYVVLADCVSEDLSGDEAPLESHSLILEVWSRQGGLSEALKIADRVVALLDGAPLVLDGARLASLAWVFTDAARATDPTFHRATLKFRALTEPV